MLSDMLKYYVRSSGFNFLTKSGRHRQTIRHICKKWLFGHFCMLQSTLQIHNTENSKQIFPEKELCGLSPNFHIQVSVNGLYIPTFGLPILLQLENMWTNPGNI
jgi:hypothetical protein